MEELLWMIGILRKIMHQIALEKGISHPDVLWISQRLDEVMNELYKVDLNEKAG